jgi:3-deoxy-D-manno-octulosonic-acid transferase
VRLWLYDLSALVVGVCLLPVLLVGVAVRPQWRTGLGERLGKVPRTPAGQPAIWLHGASVGEVTALAGIAAQLRREYPDHRLVLSSLTATGRAVAASRVPEADVRILFPLDLRWCVARTIDAVAPRLVLFSETEVWPSFLAALAARGIPAVMVSGRLSARAFGRYRRWRWLFAPALASVRWFGMQSIESARRLVVLGAPTERMVVTGSLKTAGTAGPAATALTLARLGVGGAPVLVAGSTHAGEEAALVDAWREAAARDAGLRLVLAPRHPERFDEVAAFLETRRVAFVRRSRLADGTWPADRPLLLLDTVGELAGLYAEARLAFVGGTLVPIGGHNLLEPAAQGAAVVFGPHVEHTKAAARLLVASGGGFQVRDAAELRARVADLVADPAAAARAGAAARRAVREHQGPLAVTMSLVRGSLRAPAAPAP